MNNDTELPVSTAPPHQPSKPRFFGRPTTRLGRWSVGLGAAFVVLWIINMVVFMPFSGRMPYAETTLPFYGIFMLLCGLAAGITGLVAVIRAHERSWLVWLMILPMLLVLFLLIGEFLVPH